MSTPLPMFPLGTPLLPGMGMPLQVFEPRYHAMMDDVLAGDGTFGVSLITHGHEVGGGDLRSSVGVRAEILEHRHLDNGLRLLLIVGRHRIRVSRWLRDDPYPLADVETWEDEPRRKVADPDGSMAVPRLGRLDIQARLDDIVALLSQGVTVEEDRGRLLESSTLPRDLDTAIWQATIVACLGPLDRQRLLEASGPDERLPLLVEMLEERRDVLAFTLAERH